VAHDLLLAPDATTRDWFRRDAVERLIADHTSGRTDNGHRLWTLVMLELWRRTHVEPHA
jgi:asparagine synthase (glutamine-hydrolysing)